MNWTWTKSISGGIALLLLQTVCYGASYKKATEGDEVVKNKLFPKKSRVELNGPNVGTILNQSYLDTILLNGGINYFFSESWGMGLEGSFAINTDRSERVCIETFYNDPKYSIESECDKAYDSPQLPANQGGNYGPAYVPIREINQMFIANAIWNPVYGKQILLLSATSYFDLFIIMGAGMATATYYPQSKKLKNGKDSRGTFQTDTSSGTTTATPGADPNELGSDGKRLYGRDGRPTPTVKNYPLANFGIGQKYHFMKRFSVKVELRNYTLVGTEDGFDNFFSIWGGLGVRF